jgi:hypothetical protein
MWASAVGELKHDGNRKRDAEVIAIVKVEFMAIVSFRRLATFQRNKPSK